jgi:hypothetical protein
MGLPPSQAKERHTLLLTTRGSLFRTIVITPEEHSSCMKRTTSVPLVALCCVVKIQLYRLYVERNERLQKGELP